MRSSGNRTGKYIVLDQDDMASDSPTALATQQSIKAYVDRREDYVEATNTSSVAGTLSFGAWEVPVPSWNITIGEGLWDIGLEVQNIAQSSPASSEMYLESALATSSTPGVGILQSEVLACYSIGVGMLKTNMIIRNVTISNTTTIYYHKQIGNFASATAAAYNRLRNDFQGGRTKPKIWARRVG